MTERLDRELDLKAIVGFAVGLVLVTALSVGMLWYFAQLLRSQEIAKDPPPPPLAAAGGSYQPPGPRLQTDPAAEMEQLRAAQEEILASYGWVDRAQGVARIPIERAISLMAGDDGGAATSPPSTEAAH